MFASSTLLLSALASIAYAGHALNLHNNCGNGVQPTVASCIDLPPGTQCNAYNGAQPTFLNPGASTTVNVPNGWNGRVFVQANTCSAQSGDCFSTGCLGCTLLEFTMDSPNDGGQQSYDISNINGFTQSYSLRGDGCDTVTCTSPNCPCDQAYPRGDPADKCGTSTPDHAVRNCGAGPVGFEITFCP